MLPLSAPAFGQASNQTSHGFSPRGGIRRPEPQEHRLSPAQRCQCGFGCRGIARHDSMLSERGGGGRVSEGNGPFQLRSRAGNAVRVLTRGISVLEVCLCLRRVTTRARQFKELQQVLVGSGTLGGEASRCLTLPFLGPSRVESRRGQPTEQTHVPSCLRSVWNCSPTTDSIEPTLKQNPLWAQPSPWKYNFMSSMTSSFSISSLK